MSLQTLHKCVILLKTKKVTKIKFHPGGKVDYNCNGYTEKSLIIHPYKRTRADEWLYEYRGGNVSFPKTVPRTYWHERRTPRATTRQVSTPEGTRGCGEWGEEENRLDFTLSLFQLAHTHTHTRENTSPRKLCNSLTNTKHWNGSSTGTQPHRPYSVQRTSTSRWITCLLLVCTWVRTCVPVRIQKCKFTSRPWTPGYVCAGSTGACLKPVVTPSRSCAISTTLDLNRCMRNSHPTECANPPDNSCSPRSWSRNAAKLGEWH